MFFSFSKSFQARAGLIVPKKPMPNKQFSGFGGTVLKEEVLQDKHKPKSFHKKPLNIRFIVNDFLFKKQYLFFLQKLVYFLV